MKVTLTQHPVGQGGLMSGILTSDASSFHWVYDCGSNQTSALKREIDCIKTRGHVDFLFLSHLDSDHVNGIDHLLCATSVKEVVLPYLGNIDRIIAAAHDDATGALTGTFLTFLTDIEGWFAARGVERISYIMPNSDDGEGGAGDGPILPGEDDKGGHKVEIIAQWLDKLTSINSSLIGQSVGQKGSGASLQILGLNWLFAPYAHCPSSKILELFQAELQSYFHGRHNDPNFLIDVLRNKEKREKLRACYDLIWSDHNLVSMSLYAGPIHSGKWQSCCQRLPHGLQYHPYHKRGVGWLGTGDMHLNIRRRRQAFLKYYKKLLQQVNVFVLPHHGACQNFASSLLSPLPRYAQCVAASGRNSYGHPHHSVIHAVQADQKIFVHVSEKILSALAWHHSAL
ncbi:hypothetical protein [Ferrovibrio sp.]|uniref:hypothetical protein n=1 Tax=Ferrovibrio sp. TaxID=1917215 RepID=UPI0025B99290|nr:hypothetical protein [Ferrovibrio sp.]MBX3455549.1 hypothetical protein [Ferrovibrio sp.]